MDADDWFESINATSGTEGISREVWVSSAGEAGSPSGLIQLVNSLFACMMKGR